MKPSPIFLRLTMIILTLAMPLSACNAFANDPPPAPTATQPALAEATPGPTVTQAPPAQTPAGDADQSAPVAALVLDGVAQQVATLEVAAVPPGSDTMWWQVTPQHTLLWLYGYPVSGHALQPQIFIYPVEDLGVNQAAAQAAQGLQTLLRDQQAGQNMPFLPLSGDLQVLHAQVKYLDFKNGKGVRFVTQLGNGMAPVNDHALFYTYQGLTGDGRYYLAAVLPLNLPDLPADGNDTAGLPLEFTSNYPVYVASMVNQLNLEPDDAYTPGLGRLDALVQSIEVK
jgi:hypothetical protein